MGNYWLLLGAVMWVPLLIAMFKQPKTHGCPGCGHATGLDGRHCSEVEDASGWCSDPCYCRNSYHQNYEAARR